jgi:SWI/SNF-related matrix-associated actin-dependent regulator of chromatin subfamily A3
MVPRTQKVSFSSNFISLLTNNVNRHFDLSTLNALTTIKYHGQNRERFTTKLYGADIVITTYHTLAAEVSNSNHLINDIEWYRLVLDEGKQICQSCTMRAF